ncbi:MAG: acylneuraminate cytidylyltransferase family protein [Xanthobacteraceae bacterium]
MIADARVLGLITARGGSKGLPGKNIRPLCGKPLIEWSISAAKGASCIDRIVVSTDDAAIAEVAQRAGAEVPFKRPSELATDSASSVDVVIHAIDMLAETELIFDIVVLLEPTSPLRESFDIDEGVERLIRSGAGSVVSVCRAVSAHPAFMFSQDKKGRLRPYLNQQPTGLRRQDLDPIFFLDGTLYVSRVDVLRHKRSFYHEDTVAFEVPKWKSLEIDDVDDFVMVEALMARRGAVA